MQKWENAKLRKTFKSAKMSRNLRYSKCGGCKKGWQQSHSAIDEYFECNKSPILMAYINGRYTISRYPHTHAHSKQQLNANILRENNLRKLQKPIERRDRQCNTNLSYCLPMAKKQWLRYRKIWQWMMCRVIHFAGKSLCSARFLWKIGSADKNNK